MSRLIVDVTGEQHQLIKALAATEGKSIKDFVLERVLPPKSDEQEAWDELKALLQERIKDAEAGNVTDMTMMEIAQERIKTLGLS